ncbi:uncharacterized protein TNCV_413421 [Trichonephila clavipes]|nr:uncharacterized protein TNCV_413421 [Trichonephila clavipes]
MTNIFFCAICLVSVQYVLPQVIDETVTDYPVRVSRRRTSDSVSTFLSGLGDLLLNIDETLGRQTAPKVNTEDVMKEQMYGRPRHGPNYFERVRQNYRDIQKRVGESLGMLDFRLLSNLGSVNVQSKGSKSIVDVSLPFLPMRMSVNSNPVLEDSTQTDDLIRASTTDSEIDPKRNMPHLTDVDMDNAEIVMESNFASTLPPHTLNIEPFSNKVNFELNKHGAHQALLEAEQPNLASKEDQSDFMDKEISARIGREFKRTEPPVTEDSTVSGRILGDVLYSESTFDKIMKRAMKDKKWAIDSDFVPSRIAENIRLASEKIRESVDETSKVKENTKKQRKTSNRLSEDKNEKFNRPIRNFKKRQSIHPSNNFEEMKKPRRENKLYLNPDFPTESEPHTSITPNGFLGESVILAFTPDGVPLKLRMGPEITNPLKFLHRVLSTYDVSLNIPVDSFDNIDPVGKEILQLGTGNGGTMTRALYIDLSDQFQLDSLLRTLKLSKLEQ